MAKEDKLALSYVGLVVFNAFFLYAFYVGPSTPFVVYLFYVFGNLWFYLSISGYHQEIRYENYLEETKRQKQEDEKKAKADEIETNNRKSFASTYHAKFCELARILKPFPSDLPRINATFETLNDYRAEMDSLGFFPEREDWQKSFDCFIERTRAHPLETLKAKADALFYSSDPKNRDRLYMLQKEVNALTVNNAPRNGLHVYGLPHPEADHRLHESPNPNDYLIQPADRFKHAYIIGKTGAGKTTLLRNLITQDIARGDGVIVLSPERALFDFLLQTCPTSRADDLIIYDPTDSTPPVVSLNPVHLEDPHELATEAGAVAGTLARAMGDDLSGAMQTLLLKCAYTLLQLPDSSFQDLRTLLKPISPLRDGLPHHPALDEVTREYWRDEFDKGGHRRSAEALISRLDAFFMPPLSQTMSRASFAFTEALNASRSVFLFDFSRIRGTQEAIIGQLTLSHILQTLLKRDPQPEAERIPYHLYIDEFQLYAEKNEAAFRDMLNRARKYKMSVTLAHQVTADIPPKLLDVILGNVGTKVCLQVATTDAEFFARQLHVQTFGQPREGAEYLERLKVGEGFLSTPRKHEALKITVPAEPLYYGDGLPKDDGYPARLREASKNRYGTRDTAPPPALQPAEGPRPDKPRDEDEDDGIFT